MIDNTSGEKVLSCKVTSTLKNHCSTKSTETGSAAEGDHLEVKVSLSGGFASNYRSWQVTFRY